MVYFITESVLIIGVILMIKFSIGNKVFKHLNLGADDDFFDKK